MGSPEKHRDDVPSTSPANSTPIADEDYEHSPSLPPGFEFLASNSSSAHISSPFRGISLKFLTPLTVPHINDCEIVLMKDVYRRECVVAGNRSQLIGTMFYGVKAAERLTTFMEELHSTTATAAADVRDAAAKLLEHSMSLLARLVLVVETANRRALGQRDIFYWPPTSKKPENSTEGSSENSAGAKKPDAQDRGSGVRRFDEDFCCRALFPAITFTLIQMEAVAQTIQEMAWSIEDNHVSRVVLVLARYIRLVQNKYFAVEDMILKWLCSIGGGNWISSATFAATTVVAADEESNLNCTNSGGLRGKQKMPTIKFGNMQHRALILGDTLAWLALGRFQIELLSMLMEKLSKMVEDTSVGEALKWRADRARWLAEVYADAEIITRREILQAEVPPVTNGDSKKVLAAAVTERRWSRDMYLVVICTGLADRMTTVAEMLDQHGYSLDDVSDICWDGAGLKFKISEVATATMELVESVVDEMEILNDGVSGGGDDGREGRDDACMWITGVCHVYDANTEASYLELRESTEREKMKEIASELSGVGVGSSMASLQF